MQKAEFGLPRFYDISPIFYDLNPRDQLIEASGNKIRGGPVFQRGFTNPAFEKVIEIVNVTNAYRQSYFYHRQIGCLQENPCLVDSQTNQVVVG